MTIKALAEQGKWKELIKCIPKCHRVAALYWIKEKASRRDFWRCFKVAYESTKNQTDPKLLYLFKAMKGKERHISFMKEEHLSVFLS